MAGPLDFTSAADADAFERALSGATDVPADIARLAGTARRVSSIPVPGPDAAFVASLGARLAAEAASPSPSADTTGVPSNVIAIRRTWPRAVAGTAAGLVAASAVIGVASQNALPGDALYGIRGLVDGLEVAVAGNDSAKGTTYLAQAREHVENAQTLADREPQSAADISTSLDDAAATVTSGEERLFDAFDQSRNPDDLAEVKDFTTWVKPRLTTLRDTIPGDSQAHLGALSAAVEAGEARLNAALASCGADCSAISPTNVPTPTPTTAAPSSGTTSVTGLPSSPAAPVTTSPFTSLVPTLPPLAPTSPFTPTTPFPSSPFSTAPTTPPIVVVPPVPPVDPVDPVQPPRTSPSDPTTPGRHTTTRPPTSHPTSSAPTTRPPSSGGTTTSTPTSPTPSRTFTPKPPVDTRTPPRTTTDDPPTTTSDPTSSSPTTSVTPTKTCPGGRTWDGNCGRNTPDSSSATSAATSVPAPVETTTDAPAPVRTTTDAPAPVETTTNAPAPVETTTDTPAPVETTTDTPAPVETTPTASASVTLPDGLCFRLAQYASPVSSRYVVEWRQVGAQFYADIRRVGAPETQWIIGPVSASCRAAFPG